MEGNIRIRMESLSSDPNPKSDPQQRSFLAGAAADGDPKISSNPRRLPQIPADIAASQNPNQRLNPRVFWSVDSPIPKFDSYFLSSLKKKKILFFFYPQIARAFATEVEGEGCSIYCRCDMRLRARPLFGLAGFWWRGCFLFDLVRVRWVALVGLD